MELKYSKTKMQFFAAIKNPFRQRVRFARPKTARALQANCSVGLLQFLMETDTDGAPKGFLFFSTNGEYDRAGSTMKHVDDLRTIFLEQGLVLGVKRILIGLFPKHFRYQRYLLVTCKLKR